MKSEHQPNYRDGLEKLVDRALRAQPLVRAPRSLEGRVFAEIERRVALPWWRKSFSSWPIAARLAFLVASVGFVKLGLDAAIWLVMPFETTTSPFDLPPEMSWIQTVIAALAITFRSLPPTWLYGAIGLLAITYAALFGIGATVYRTVHAAR
ncbi:MAG: hypothetical protein ACREUC_17400 [Steroidobacteraceae bacterium]